MNNVRHLRSANSVLEGGRTKQSTPNYTRRRLTALSIPTVLAGLAVAHFTYGESDKKTAAKVNCDGYTQVIVDHDGQNLESIARTVSRGNKVSITDVMPFVTVSPVLRPELVEPTQPGSAYSKENGYRIPNDAVHDYDRAVRAGDNILQLGEVVQKPAACHLEG